MAASLTGFSGCVLLVYGVPGSGKTRLTDCLCSERASCPWATLPVHLDWFYPPDTRAVSLSKAHSGESEADVEAFQMKQTRLEVVQCLQHLIELSLNPGQTSPPPLWGSFASYLQSYTHLVPSDANSSEAHLPSPTVLVVDDNLPLKSMRYIFYQLAKKYGLGFAELCICCDVAVARERNSRRQIPIPDSTIMSMERSLELPDQSRQHWERHSFVIFNSSTSEEDFLTHALSRAKELISSALAEPEIPPPPPENTIKETSRSESMESYLHQTDIILRKCVTFSIREYTGADKGYYAKRLNSVRKEMLAELKAGGLVEADNSPPLSSEHDRKIQSLFQSRLHPTHQ